MPRNSEHKLSIRYKLEELKELKVYAAAQETTVTALIKKLVREEMKKQPITLAERIARLESAVKTE